MKVIIKRTQTLVIKRTSVQEVITNSDNKISEFEKKLKIEINRWKKGYK